jgi:hypothetical protein
VNLPRPASGRAGVGGAPVWKGERMKKNLKPSKFKLNSETLRSLEAPERLDQVQGGNSFNCSSSCHMDLCPVSWA